jgi:hypothetical protein
LADPSSPAFKVAVQEANLARETLGALERALAASLAQVNADDLRRRYQAEIDRIDREYEDAIIASDKQRLADLRARALGANQILRRPPSEATRLRISASRAPRRPEDAGTQSGANQDRAYWPRGTPIQRGAGR